MQFKLNFEYHNLKDLITKKHKNVKSLPPENIYVIEYIHIKSNKHFRKEAKQIENINLIYQTTLN